MLNAKRGRRAVFPREQWSTASTPPFRPARLCCRAAAWTFARTSDRATRHQQCVTVAKAVYPARAGAMAKKPTPRRLAEPVWPNAGVEAWYRGRLQTIVLAMANDMLARVRAVWREGDGFATDSMTREAAGVIFRDPRGFVLMLNRADGSGWGWPGGGVEPGETHDQAARRECREEIGLEYAGPLLTINIQGGPVRYVTFIADAPRAFLPTLNAEHCAFAWVPVERALALPLYPSVRSTLLTCGLIEDPQAIGMDAKARKPSTSLLLRRALSKWGTLWTRRIETMSDTIAHDFAVKNRNATDKAMQVKLAKAGFAVKFSPTPAAVNAFDAVVAENVGLIRSIPQKFLTDVQAAVWQAVMSGSDLKGVTDQITEKYGIAWRRAALIATDQNAKAKAAMERARRMEVGITEARWRHSHAGKEPRPSHVKAGADGVIYEIAKGWWDPHEQKRIWPGTLIRCRCGDQAVIPGF